MDARHQGCIGIECRGHLDVLFVELALGIGQVELVEHTVVPVLGQRTPVEFAESLTLIEQAMQIGLGTNLLGRNHTTGNECQAIKCLQHAQGLKVGHYRELLFLLFGTSKLIVDMIQAHSVFGIANGHYIDTLAWGQVYLPVVLGYTCYNIVVTQGPALAHVAVFNPDIGIVLGKLVLANGILHKQTGVRFAIVVHNLSLIVYQILNAEGR